ncbi:hypothetical protein GCM10018785_39560 [Streptomyces longispororuber]|uniref:DUF3558 domain-containing protein n=1 Tax=Streptomyces longispororuber TaxID=68230 RepID=A0A918ZRM7_9ACTN|nr:DUF3558 domain-containing protein [Streptomyces longispororuber]GHE66851.1 hypothetical protein GCM10018785_39560 [Streptomyces longispororuber]
MHRPAQRQRQRLTRVLVGAAAAPVILFASACSGDDSGSGSDGAKKDTGAESSASAPSGSGKETPTVEKAAFAKLPEPCETLTKKTLGDLVPAAKDKSGRTGTSDDVSTRGNCTWESLDDNGVDGSQFRWLRVALNRFESDQSLGSGAKRAQANFTKQVADAQAVKGAKNVKTTPVPGTGDQATLVSYDLKKDKETFKQQTLVARVENAVVAIDYNGAGLAGDKQPDGGDLAKDTQKAAKEAVGAVVAANEPGGGASSKAPGGGAKDDAKDDAKGGKDGAEGDGGKGAALDGGEGGAKDGAKPKSA